MAIWTLGRQVPSILGNHNAIEYPQQNTRKTLHKMFSLIMLYGTVSLLILAVQSYYGSLQLV